MSERRGCRSSRARFPINIVGAAGEMITKNREALTATGVVPTSVDNMNPRHHFIRALQDIPMAPGIHAHSIIAVQGTGPIEDGDDGVVKYSSAQDRKSTRLNSSHVRISYAVFCLKKKKIKYSEKYSQKS